MTQHLNPVRLILATLLFTSPVTTLNRWSILLIWPGRFWRCPGRDIQACQEKPVVYNINHQRSRTIP